MTEKRGSEQSALDVSALKRGDDGAWESFFETYDDTITSVVRWSKWHFKPDVQEDVAQEIRAELLRCITNFRAASSLRYYIKRICINRCVDRIRKQVRERSVIVSLGYEDADGELREMDAPSTDQYDPIKKIYTFETVGAVRELLKHLDGTCLEAIQLFYMEGLAYKEIAKKLGISINTVGSRLAKCLEKLRRNAQHDPILREESSPDSDTSK